MPYEVGSYPAFVTTSVKPAVSMPGNVNPPEPSVVVVWLSCGQVGHPTKWMPTVAPDTATPSVGAVSWTTPLMSYRAGVGMGFDTDTCVVPRTFCNVAVISASPGPATVRRPAVDTLATLASEDCQATSLV